MKTHLNVIKNMLLKSINILFLACFILINYLVLFTATKTSYTTKKTFLYSNIRFLLVGIVVILTISLILHMLLPRLQTIISRLPSFRIICIVSLLFMALQIYCIYQYYFLSGWDVAGVVDRSEAIATGIYYSPGDPYLSRYPNNALLCALYARVIRVGNMFGVSHLSGNIMFLLVFQCILFFISALLLYRSLVMITGNTTPAIAGWFVYMLFTGISPWLAIPYSDATGMIFPITILYCYLAYKKSAKSIYLFLIGFLTCFAYYIKPQTIIITIAIIIFETLQMLSLPKKKFLTYTSPIFIIIFAIGCAMFIKTSMLFTSRIDLNRDMQFGVPHWIMMGLNEERNGVYSAEDVTFSASFPNQETRTAGNIAVIKERLAHYNLNSLSRHLQKKLLTSFADGTFAWSKEGTFYYEIFPEKNPLISPQLRDFYYQDGTNHHRFETHSQLLWIPILFGSLCAGLAAWKPKETPALPVLLLSLTGITLFLLLFEVRARYLFCTLPLFIITAVLGWQYIIQKLLHLVKHKTK